VKQSDCKRYKLYPSLCSHCCVNAEKQCDTLVAFEYPIVVTKEEMQETHRANEKQYKEYHSIH